MDIGVTASSVFDKRVAAFAKYDLDELVDGYEDFEEEVQNALTELSTEHFSHCVERVTREVLIIEGQPYYWGVAYDGQRRTSTLLILPAYRSRAAIQQTDRETAGLGRVLHVNLMYVNAISRVAMPLFEACCQLVMNAHALLESCLLGSLASCRNELLSGIDELVVSWCYQNNVDFGDLTYAFSVTSKDVVQFSYALSADNVREAIRRCNAAQLLGASPFELITTLLTTEMADAVLEKAAGAIPPVTIVPYATLDSMETNYKFWTAERQFLGGTALAAVDVGTYGNYMLQLNLDAAAQDVGLRLVNDTRDILLARFRSNVDRVHARFGRAGRFVRKFARKAAREASIDYLADLFWKIVLKPPGPD